MEPGSALNWLLAVAMLGGAIIIAMTGTATFRGGMVIDRAAEPVRFWIFVIASGFVGAWLLVHAVFYLL
ncbi:hypothetical protein PX699_29775 [Sphingobium sp. H39-3-25]|uniref:hypothetical protein n=1 Tax=Sphingobium arseniciresistens TaxID=3030834 RepID=UPI0023B98ED9|nr:hypothetical protein [Sphingobium arseniciresistens]